MIHLQVWFQWIVSKYSLYWVFFWCQVLWREKTLQMICVKDSDQIANYFKNIFLTHLADYFYKYPSQKRDSV